MRILVVGDWHSDIHEQAWADALETLGHKVDRMAWHHRLESRWAIRSLLLRIENKLIVGPAVWAINAELLRRVVSGHPDVVILYRGTHVLASSVRLLKKLAPETILATYNNDDPFSENADPLLWRHYKRALQWTDVNWVYRSKNIEDLVRLNARRVSMIRSAYIPEIDHPFALTAAELERFGSDVFCAVHYEPDGRVHFLRALATAGIGLRLNGPDWDRAPDEAWLRRLRPIEAIRGEDYRKAISASRICLSFLSGLNHDTYTRRCFEIPAVGGFLLCQRSHDMETLFEPDREASFFDTPQELLDKVRYYLAHSSERQRIAKAGHEKVKASGHDIFSRMKVVERILLETVDSRIDSHEGTAKARAG